MLGAWELTIEAKVSTIYIGCRLGLILVEVQIKPFLVKS